MQVGELFILGFFGKTIPDWLKNSPPATGSAASSCSITRSARSNTTTTSNPPNRCARLCAEIAALPSSPMVFIDQEGGLVRRLKEGRGFAPLPSAKEFNHLAAAEKRRILAASLGELRALGIHYDFAPVIDVDYNPDNPNIGRIKRSYSADIAEVEANALLMSDVAREARVGLCLKHFPGIGGARVDSHQEFMDISDALHPEQEALFYSLAPKMFGNAVLVSHAIVRQWDERNPATLSPAADRPAARAASRHAADHRRYADAGFAEGAWHQGGQPAIAARGHGHALHRQQFVRSGAGDG